MRHIALILILTAPTWAFAEEDHTKFFNTGNIVKYYKDTTNTDMNGLALTYVIGVADAFQIVDLIHQRDNTKKEIICPPQGMAITADLIISLIQPRLDQLKDLPFAVTAVRALQNAFPCN